MAAPGQSKRPPRNSGRSGTVEALDEAGSDQAPSSSGVPVTKLMALRLRVTA
jgi:hypothetical protein